ncbi:MAG: secretin N-terminal domain-containing protein [Thermoanaerobaculia bacterium]
MKNVTRIIGMIFLLSAMAGGAWAAGQKLEVRAFPFQYKSAENAAAAVKPLLSSEGSISIQSNTNRLVVTDFPENLKKISALIEQFDTKPRTFRISVKLVLASRAASSKPVPEDLREIADKLSGVLRFNSFEKIGELNAEGKEGDPVLANIDGYRADFTIGEYDLSTDSLQVSDFRLGRKQQTPKGEEIENLLTTSLNLRTGQTLVLGASRSPQSGRILMLVLTATRTD